jgi:OOP family OmpA-OmpF porin
MWGIHLRPSWFTLLLMAKMLKRRLTMKANYTARPFGVLLLIGSVAAAFAPTGALAQQRAAGAAGGAGGAGGQGTGALAQQRAAGAGWYGGLSVGSSQIRMNDNMLPVGGATASSLAKDESSTGFKLFGGYRYNPNFALEGGYTDLGKFDARRDVTAPVVGSISRNMRMSGFDLAAVGIIPMQSGFSLFGKIGAMYTMTRSSVSIGGALLPAPGFTEMNPRRSEWNPKFGLGAGYDFSNGMGLRLEYERVSNVGDAATGEGNVGMWSLGLTKRF